MIGKIRILFNLQRIFLLIFINILILNFVTGQENTFILCSNGIDDDGDGFIDCLDPDCICLECIKTPQIYTGDQNNWEVSDKLFEEPFKVPFSNFPLPNAPSVKWNKATAIVPCSQYWVDPQTLPSPMNKAKWITHPKDQDCIVSLLNTYYFYKTSFLLPCSCDGQPNSSSLMFTFKINAYADNEILAVYVNDIKQNIPGLSTSNFDTPITINLNASWRPFDNSITFLIHNHSWHDLPNPHGFLCVLNSDSDIDLDGVNDYNDLCICDNNSIIDTNYIFKSSENPLDTGIVVDSYFTKNGCDSTVVTKTTLEITVDITNDNRIIFIPNAFSPNLDGSNDYFTIFANPDLLVILKMRIYDRWGNLVFEKLNFEPNNPMNGWNGTFKEKVLNPGVFTYVAEIKWIDEKIELLKGDITLFK